MINFIKALLVLLCLHAVSLLAASGDIVKCIQRDGSVVYSNLGCGDDKMEQVVLRPLTIAETPKTNFSFLSDLPLSSMQWVLAIYVLMSVICFLMYWLDKKRSIKGEWRIPEKTLHLLEWLGGWPGAFIAQQLIQSSVRMSHDYCDLS